MYSTKMIMDFKEHWQDAVAFELFEDPEYCIGIMTEPALFKALDVRLRETKELYDKQYAQRLRELSHTKITRWGAGDKWNWFMIGAAVVAGVVGLKVAKKVFDSTPAGMTLQAGQAASQITQRAASSAERAPEARTTSRSNYVERRSNDNRRRVSERPHSSVVSFNTSRGHFMGVLRQGDKSNELYQRV